jgi:hypothetical protein
MPGSAEMDLFVIAMILDAEGLGNLGFQALRRSRQFRDWAAEASNYPRRRGMMVDWVTFCHRIGSLVR